MRGETVEGEDRVSRRVSQGELMVSARVSRRKAAEAGQVACEPGADLIRLFRP